jgi:hypothetical protein
MAGVDANNWNSALLELVEEPDGKHTGLEANAHSIWSMLADKLLNLVRRRRATPSPKRPTGFIDYTSFGFFKRHIKTNILGDRLHCVAPRIGNQCLEASNEPVPRLPHVPTNHCAGVARSGGPGRPKGRREAALPWTGTSTAARLRLFERSLRAVAPSFVVLTVSNATAVAQTRPAEPAASYRTSDPFADFVEEASRRFGVPVQWIGAVIDIERAGDVRTRSPKGAMGLMQIMPETWAEVRLRYDLRNNPYDPRDNILAGTAYLRELHDQYGLPGFLAAYNAGPARYEEHLAGRPLPAETQTYLQKLLPIIGSNVAAPSAVASLRSSAETLFVVRSESSKTAARLQPVYPPNRAPTAAPIYDISAIVPQATGLFVVRSNAGGPR